MTEDIWLPCGSRTCGSRMRCTSPLHFSCPPAATIVCPAAVYVCHPALLYRHGRIFRRQCMIALQVMPPVALAAPTESHSHAAAYQHTCVLWVGR